MLFTRIARADRTREMSKLRLRRLHLERLEGRLVLSATATQAVNQFAMDVYEHLQQEQGNLFFSPLSISAGLAMTYAGAAGQTAAEMGQVLGIDPGIHASFANLLASFEQRQLSNLVFDPTDPLHPFKFVDRFKLSTSNAIWPQSGLPVHGQFINTIETNYDGHVQSVDYANPLQAEDLINDWVADQTNGRIQNLVSGLSPATAMVLTNTIFFNSLWDVPFDPRFTASRSFQRGPGDVISAPQMQTQGKFAITQIGGFRVLDMPMGNGNSSMVVLLPSDPSGAGHLTNEVLQGVEGWLESSPALKLEDVAFPRFQTTVETGLNELLVGLGMSSAFSAATADFSSMTDAAVFIDKVFHKATIDVTEQGTQAAAATEVQIAICFTAGTPVLTLEGAKPIELLQAGDVVLARDEKNAHGEIEAKKITETHCTTAEVLELHVRGKAIRTTKQHPFYVVGQGWTVAHKIRVGDYLATNQREPAVVDKVVETGETEKVYNLTVADHKTFFVGGNEWGFAVWTHNICSSGTEFIVNRPFHFLIRDNVTSTIAFMGRINDPSQLQNNVNPTVTSVSGDYNRDGNVDNQDYLAWRGTFGQTGAGLATDGNTNSVVDAADYIVWRHSRQASVSPRCSASQLPELAQLTASSGTAEVSTGMNENQLVSHLAVDASLSSLESVPLLAPQLSRAAPVLESRLQLPFRSLDVGEEDLLLIAASVIQVRSVNASSAAITASELSESGASWDEAFEELGNNAGLGESVAAQL